MTIVIPLVAGIGNALLAEPMIRQLRASRPAARVVAAAISKPIAQAIERVEGVETLVTGKGLKNLIAGVRQTRALSPDVYLVPFPSNRWQYNVLAAASGAKRVILHDYPIGKLSALGFLHGKRVPSQRGIHDVVQNLRLLEALDIKPDYTMAPRFEVTPADEALADRVLADAGLNGNDFVVIHAGSAQTILAEAKRWPTENYARLIEAIRAQTNLRVLVVEGPDEPGVSTQIVEQVANRDGVHTAALRGHLATAAALLKRAAFYAGTDSGLAHLAAAVGRRAITLFAPADPDRVCPFGNRDLVVQPPNMGAPSFLYPWESTKPKMRGKDESIETITVDQVMEKVQPLSAAHVRESATGTAQ